jgi:diguanylate cyclase (GGDEF)-like protein/PAS domain S-box-containing protein
MEMVNINFFLRMAEELDISVRFVDKDKKIIYINRSAEKLTGYSMDDVLNKTCEDYLERHTDKAGKKLCYTNCHLDFSLKEKKEYDDRHYFKNKVGDTFPVDIKVIPVMDDDGELLGAVEFMQDDRPRLVMEELKLDIQRMIPVDLLTGLYTRTKIMEYFEVKVEDSIRYKAPLGVIHATLKNSKHIKDEYGAKKLDEIFQRVGYLVRMNTRRGDISGRVGPDSFIILLPNFNAENCKYAAQKLKEILVEDTTTIFPGTVSIEMGAAQFQDGDDTESLLKRAKESVVSDLDS